MSHKKISAKDGSEKDDVARDEALNHKKTLARCAWC